MEMGALIPHALVRNTLIPFVALIYYAHINTEADFDVFYNLCMFCLIVGLPSYIVFAGFGFNPLQYYIYPTWRSGYSVVQYLVYMIITHFTVYLHSKDYTYSATVSIISAGAAGYLYEVPMWLIRGGLLELVRTARNSFIVFDFGMLCVPYLVYLLYQKRFKPDNRLLLVFMFYLVYVVSYMLWFPELYLAIYNVVPIPTVVFRRIPAMLLTYTAAYSVHEKQHTSKTSHHI